MEFEAVIGLEVHAELETVSKMFCSCPVVEPSIAEPNSAVCPVCTGMPGVLPVVNQRAVDFALRVAIALDCEIATTSVFARKNYFYPDLPKGYQISQYEHPLASNGRLTILTSQGEHLIRVRRVHLEEDTGKLTHINVDEGESYSLVDLNRSGIPLLEIVSEPDLRSAEQVRAYATGLRSILRYLGVNSGDMQKGVMRIEPNISVRPLGSTEMGTRVEIKNLNSFRALERSVAYEIERQSEQIRKGQPVLQETVGWDESQGVTFTQRVKETEDDYRYFPEPDLPPLVVSSDWIEQVRAALPELPLEKIHRFQQDYRLNEYDAGVLVAEAAVADYFEATIKAAGLESGSSVTPKMVSNWLTGDLFGLLNQTGTSIEAARVSPQAFAGLLQLVAQGDLNQTTAKAVLHEIFATGESASDIVSARGLQQISDRDHIARLVKQVLDDNPEQLQEYLAGKQAIVTWLFGQVMRTVQGKANPQVVQAELDRQLQELQ